jgi:putative hemolysin
MNELHIDVRKLIGDKNPALLKKLPRFAISYLERIIHQKEINSFLEKYGHLKNHEFCESLIDYLNIQIEFNGLDRIPKTGPIIIVLNHPLGGVDGVAFIAAMKNHRPDLVFLVNDLLLNIIPLKDLFVGVNKHGKNRSDTRDTIASMFNSDKAICIFPAGLVSRKQQGIIKDLEWKRTFVTYAKTTGHPIIPIHIGGKLSRFFYGLHRLRTWLGIKTTLEMLYLVDELYKQRGKKIVFTVGEPIILSDDEKNKDEQRIAQEIKEQLYKIPTLHGTNNRSNS